jgi:hypothetical protein
LSAPLSLPEPLDPETGRPPGARAGVELQALRAHLPLALFGAAFLALGALHAAGLVGRPPLVVAGIGLAFGVLRSLLVAFASLRRRLLWRIRRKLIVSYVLIAFVPIALISALFALLAYIVAGQFLTQLASRHLRGVTSEVDSAAYTLVRRARAIAEDTPSFAGFRDAALQAPDLAAGLGALRERYPSAVASLVVTGPGASETFVPAGLDWPVGAKAGWPRWLGQAALRERGAPSFEAAFVLQPEGRLELRGAHGEDVSDLRI